MMMDEIFEKYCYIDDNEKWQIKNDAPDEAKELFKSFMSDEPDENGIITRY